ncbi:MAG: right-handed parallel beta-helix repeat-containing protein, partial [Chitinophagia bacterium]|nr:right-handed parallel beta-helix repeat-containing protein [Chitinophagia bacterium]
TLNGKDFSIPFTAYGQNAHYIVSDSITTATTWLTDKPYVVVHACVIGPGASLKIPANCKVFMHQDARFFVYGSLSINPDAGPTSKDSVVLQGDRLDRDYFGYKGYPGEWGGIYVVTGGKCVIKNAVIKNCGGSSPYYNYGIQPAALEVDTGGSLELTNTIIKNSIGHGIFCFQGKVTATNCLVVNCGGQALAVVLGGIDSFTNCTFANYGTYALQHIDNPTVGILNWLQVSQTEYLYAPLNMVMRNCIVWGSLDSEVIYDTTGSYLAGVNDVRLLFDHCLLKKGEVETQKFARFLQCFNADPLFVSEEKWDFHIPGNSPAAGVSSVSFTPNYDLEGNLRTFGRFGYDIGCYQSKP